MKQTHSHLSARRHFLAVSIMAATGTSTLVSCREAGSKALSFHMGERATAGKLIYLALETEWKTALGEGATARIPHNKFLLLRVSVTNGGGAPVALPLLSLYDANGKQHRELDDVENLPAWMGALRMLAPVETKVGLLVFDVPTASYKLQITDAGDIENEAIAYIDIPLQIEANPTLAEPPAVHKR